jgi:predicted DNA-binding transcriptional regulator AlpA
MNNLIPKGKLAEELNISTRTLDRWHSLRKGPPRVKVGNFIGYRQEAVQLWLLQNETSPIGV